MEPLIAPLTSADWPDVQRIYAEGIATGMATFETEPPATWEDFIRNRRADFALSIRVSPEAIAGWVILSSVSTRQVYRGVAEVSQYLAADFRGQGLGSRLLAEMITQAEAGGFWTLQSHTFPENRASLALQQRHGFRVIGRRTHIGRMKHGPLAGKWRDTILLERRSTTVGLE